MIPSTNNLIVVGEDDKDDQELLKEVFTSIDESFSLVFADTGKQVINLLIELQDEPAPCLIVLDYNMPELNGADILKELNDRGIYRSVPKVVWSTSGSEKFKLRCLQLGAADYVIKPDSISSLKGVARYLISICSNGTAH